MEKVYQSFGNATLCLGQKTITWGHIHSGTAFLFVQHPAQVSLLLLGVCCTAKLFFKKSAFSIWIFFLIALQAFRGK